MTKPSRWRSRRPSRRCEVRCEGPSQTPIVVPALGPDPRRGAGHSATPAGARRAGHGGGKGAVVNLNLALNDVADAVVEVLGEFAAELARASDLHPGTFRLPDGTGGGGRKTWETIAKNSCDRAAREGRLTHTHVFDEETAEVMAAETTEDLRKELVQSGAMSLKWILDIDSRSEP